MEKIPFYQAFEAYETNQKQMWENDQANLRAMYPRAARRVLREVEREFNLLESQNSFIFHENPDRVQLEVLSGKIYKRLLNINEDERVMKAQSFLMPEPEFLPFRQDSEPDYTRPFPPGPDRNSPPYTPAAPGPAPSFNPRNSLSAPYDIVPSFMENGEPNWLKQLIDVLVIEEMAKRRRRRSFLQPN